MAAASAGAVTCTLYGQTCECDFVNNCCDSKNCHFPVEPADLFSRLPRGRTGVSDYTADLVSLCHLHMFEKFQMLIFLFTTVRAFLHVPCSRAGSNADVYGLNLAAAPNVVSWTEPSPAYGSSRVVVLLLKQMTGFVPPAAMRVAMGYPKTYTNATMPKKRANFNAAAFADHFRLALVNAMFFYVPCITVSAQALNFSDSSTFSLTECTPLYEGACYELWPQDGNVSAVNVCPCGEASNEHSAPVSVVSSSADTVRDKSVEGRRAQWGGYGVSAVYSALNALSLSDDLCLKQGSASSTRNTTAINLTVSFDGQEVLNGAVVAWNATNQSTWKVNVGSADGASPSNEQLYSLLLLDPQAVNAGNG